MSINQINRIQSPKRVLLCIVLVKLRKLYCLWKKLLWDMRNIIHYCKLLAEDIYFWTWTLRALYRQAIISHLIMFRKNMQLQNCHIFIYCLFLHIKMYWHNLTLLSPKRPFNHWFSDIHPLFGFNPSLSLNLKIDSNSMLTVCKYYTYTSSVNSFSLLNYLTTLTSFLFNDRSN